MNILRTARFSTLFAVAFAVGASFLGLWLLLAFALAFISPGFFTLNGAQATNAGEALAALVFVSFGLLILNAAISTLGSLIWLGVRRLLLVGLPKTAGSAPP